MKVKLWGTRAQIPAPHPDTQGDGGNTICLEIAEEIAPTLILDAGTGLHWLGNDLLKGAYGRSDAEIDQILAVCSGNSRLQVDAAREGSEYTLRED